MIAGPPAGTARADALRCMSRLSFSNTLGLVALALLIAPSAVQAYATGSSATKDCHERITWSALDGSSWPDGATPPPDEQAERLAEQLAVTVPERHQNLWAVSTGIGTRWPDFQGSEPSDFVALNGVHQNPVGQREHCLRMAEHDDVPGGDPAGSRAALEDCRAFIMEQVTLALGPDETVDLNATETVEMWLAFVGKDEVDVQRFGFHMGQALHALQDSFSHTVRTEDGHRVRHVLNYIELAGDGLNEDVDGHAHSSALDDCELGTPLLDARVSQAMAASTDLLNAVADGSNGRAGRIANVHAVLERWLSFAEDDPCVNDIDQCQPPELAQTQSGCSAGGRLSGGAIALILGVLGFLAFRRRAIGVAAALVFGGLMVASVASAQDVPPTSEEAQALEAERAAEAEARAQELQEAREQAEEEAREDALERQENEEEVREQAQEIEAEGGVVVGVDEEGDELAVVQKRQIEAEDGGMAVNDGVGFQVSLFGSLDDAGIGASLGLRFPLTPHFILGVDTEYDAWLSVEAGRFETGAWNSYLTGIIVWATLDRVELRTNLHAGLTVQLSELYNSERFSMGPFFGITPVAVAVRVSRAVRVTIDPGGIFVEIPRVDPGPPLLRRAHRLMIGLQITP